MAVSCVFGSPVGLLKISEENEKITGLSVVENAECIEKAQDIKRRSMVLYEAYRQLGEYFEGKRKVFDLLTDCQGTVFQRQVWRELQRIPYGETRCYQEIAAGIGNPAAVRAVGQANGRNPVMIIIPCHRVIRKSGDIAGFAYGIEVKRYLLELERNVCGR